MAAPKKDDAIKPRKSTGTGKPEPAKKTPAAPVKQAIAKPAAAKPKK